MSDLEDSFAVSWALIVPGHAPQREYRFAPGRRYAFDFAWPARDGGGAALEIEGCTYTNGRHVRGSGYRHDCEKYNLAASLGWRVFRATSDMLHDGLCSIVAMIAEAGSSPESRRKAIS